MARAGHGSEITGMLVGLGFIFVRTRRVVGEASRTETHKSAAKSQGLSVSPRVPPARYFSEMESLLQSTAQAENTW